MIPCGPNFEDARAVFADAVAAIIDVKKSIIALMRPAFYLRTHLTLSNAGAH